MSFNPEEQRLKSRCDIVTEFFPEWCQITDCRTKTVENLERIGISDSGEFAWRISFGPNLVLTFPMKFARKQDAAQAARVLNQTKLTDLSIGELIDQFADLEKLTEFVRTIAESLAF